jgi:hypothetical protein
MGYYAVEEEALFLEGSFRMTDLEYPGVTYGFFPRGYRRVDSVSVDGALALASFGGRADWVQGSTVVDAGAAVRVADWRALPVTASAELRAAGRLLRRHPIGSTWLFEDAPSGQAPADAVLELFSVSDHSWERVLPGAAIPALAPPVYCRVRSLGP